MSVMPLCCCFLSAFAFSSSLLPFLHCIYSGVFGVRMEYLVLIL